MSMLNYKLVEFNDVICMVPSLHEPLPASYADDALLISPAYSRISNLYLYLECFAHTNKVFYS